MKQTQYDMDEHDYQLYVAREIHATLCRNAADVMANAMKNAKDKCPILSKKAALEDKP